MVSKILFLLENHLDLSEDSIDWLDRHSSLPFPERLTTFLEEVVLAEIHGSLVLLFDEIEQTLSCPFEENCSHGCPLFMKPEAHIRFFSEFRLSCAEWQLPDN